MKTKDAAFRIRVEKELRDEFVELCRRGGRPAAQVIREFMREYVEQRRQTMQTDLFSEKERKPSRAR